MAERQQSFRSITYTLKHDAKVPPEVTFVDVANGGRKWVKALFIYEDKRRFHCNMTFEEFLVRLRTERRYDVWTQVAEGQEHVWVAMSL